MPRPRDAFHLTLADAEANDPDASPAASRLKRASKVLLRTYGLRCARAESRPADPAGATVEIPGTQDEASSL
jgi:hypothetical protein